MRTRNGALALTALLTASCADYSKQVTVDWGSTGYVNGAAITSKDYGSCTAVALDSGDEAVMAHAYPGDGGHLKNQVSSQDAVRILLQKASQQKMDRSQMTAYVSAGVEEDLELITSELEKQGIPVRYASVDYSGNLLRNVRFDPNTNDFSVFPSTTRHQSAASNRLSYHTDN